jgi:phthiocerol/phenolphthiocerol synthesis type-I polyketide synthase E
MGDKMNETFPSHAIAVVGLGGRFPGARDLDEFWQNLKNGVESIETFSDADLDASGIDPALRANEHYVRRGTVLEGADLFDASFFNMSPREAQLIDPQQRIFLECAWEALEHAGHAPGTIEGAVGVYAGASMNTYLLAQIIRNPALIAAAGGYQLMLGNDKDYLCTRASYKLDLRGPSITIQTACSSSLVAVQVACQALERRECEMALAGGVSVSFPQRGGYLFQEGMILSPDGHCRPFDASARGTRSGAGCGIVVLKRLSDALADRDTIHAVIRGAAVNNDGAGKAGFTAPSVDGQVEVIATAQMLAGVEPRSIGYVEAHGTATPLGDPIEVAALTQVFRAGTADVGFCKLGSLKSNLGHLDAAAGVAGLIKAILTLKHQEFSPLVNFERPNPQLGLEHSPFLASAQGAAWPSGPSPRRAGVSSFGIGGTNAHVVLEEAPPAPIEPAADKAQLLVLSARSAETLDAAAQRLAAQLVAHPGQSLADVAWTLQVGRRAFAHRRTIVAKDSAQAIELLRSPDRPPVYSAVHEGGDRPVAFLFSGQGSQFAGMGADLYRGEPVYRAAVDRCSDLLQKPLQRDLREILFAPAGDLTVNETRYAQPALFVTEFALALLWQQRGLRPAAMLGHSIGEYVAAHLAGVMSLEDALMLVAARGRLMQAMPPGAMAAVQLDSERLTSWLSEQGCAAEIAAINAPRMCTIAGASHAMAECVKRLEAQGIETRLLHTSHAFHSSMFDPVLAPFTAIVEKVALSPPTLPYISNVTGDWISPQKAVSPAYYAQHLRQTVWFEAGMRVLARDPTLHFLEVGPGNALTSLARLCLVPDGMRRTSASFGAARDKPGEAEGLLETAGRLWLAGVPLDWVGLHGGSAPKRVPLPTYPFERKSHWVEAAAPAPSPTAADGSSAFARKDHVHDWLFAPTWLRGDKLNASLPHLNGTWLVVGGTDALASAVAAGIDAAGGDPLRVQEGASYARRPDGSCFLRPGDAEDVAALSRDARSGGKTIAGAIILWGLEAEAENKVRQLRVLYHAQVAFASGLRASLKAPVRLIIATSGAQSVLDEPITFVDAAAAYGPVLALPGEVEGLHLRLVDLVTDTRLLPPEAAAALVAEAATADAENQVAWRVGRRWLRRFEPCPLPAPTPDTLPLRQGAVVLITGGLGGMGLAIAGHLANRKQARLLLTARSAIPPRAQWDDWLNAHPHDENSAALIKALHAIEAAGGEVEVAVADVADRAAMRDAIDVARNRWGGIDAVIHAAGIPGSGELSILKSANDVEAVFAPKAGGLEVLLQVLGDASLELVVLMSSINSVVGAPGAGDYAAANAVLDAFVESDRVPPNWRRVVSFNWGAWREVGMAAKLVVPAGRRAAWETYLKTGIGTADGLDAFDRVVASRNGRVVVLPYDLGHLLARARAPADTGTFPTVASKPAPAVPGSESDGLPPAAGQGLDDDLEGAVEPQLAAIWIELLGVERVGAHDDFFELGGHSLLATRVLARAEEKLGARLVLRDLFDAPTLRALADRIVASRVVDEEREEFEF